MTVQKQLLTEPRPRGDFPALFWALIAVVVVSPIPFGAIEMWAWAPMAVAVGLLMIAWSATLAFSKRAPPVDAAMVWPILALFVAVVGWAVFQTLPYSPSGWHHPMWRMASAQLGVEIPGRISINPFDTGSAILRLMSYAGIFWLALQYCRSAKRAREALYCIAIAGLVYAGYGLVVEFTGSRLVLWFPKTHYLDSLTSTFRYKNAYATFAGLGLICCLGLLVDMIEDLSRDYGRRETARLALTRLLEKGWILVIGVISLFTALLLSDSRGGVLATYAAIAVLFISIGFTRSHKKQFARKAAGLVLAAGVAFAMLSGGAIIDRLAPSELENDLRPRIFGLTVNAIQDGPWIGTGYGTFGEVFRFYRTMDLPAPVRRAHNTYLDSALELGIPASAALTAAVLGLGVLCLLGLRRRRRDCIVPCIGLAASTLIALHAMVDFTVQVPAVAATYCLLAGAACGQSWSSRIRAGESH